MQVPDEKIVDPSEPSSIDVNYCSSNCSRGQRSYSNYWATLNRSSLPSPDSWSGYNGPTYWARVDLGSAYMVTGVVTRGRGDAAQWVKTYTCKTSSDGSTWEQVKDASGTAKVLNGNGDQNTLVEGIFPTPVWARHVELEVKTYNGHPSMRFAVLVTQSSSRTAPTNVAVTQLPAGAVRLNLWFSMYPISSWDTSQITDMDFLFQDKSACNPDVENWETSNVTSMHGTFDGTASFNRNLGRWDVSRVTDMSSMFRGASLFNGDVTSWDTGKVVDMDEMFVGADAFRRDISGWKVDSTACQSKPMWSSSRADNYYCDIQPVPASTTEKQVVCTCPPPATVAAAGTARA